MGILGKLFGSDKVVGGVVDGVYNGIDKLAYTPEEKADNFRGMLKLYEPFKIAQRLLALTFSIPYMLAWLGTFTASFWVNVDVQYKLLNGDVGSVVMLIVAFYFAGGVADTFMNKKK